MKKLMMVYKNASMFQNVFPKFQVSKIKVSKIIESKFHTKILTIQNNDKENMRSKLRIISGIMLRKLSSGK